MGAARRLDPAFGLAQFRGFGLELIAGAHYLLRVALALGGRIAPAQVPEQLLLGLQVRLESLVPPGHLSLLLELLDLARQLEADVGHPREVLAGVRKAVLGFAAPFLVLGDTGGFLEENAKLLRLGLDDARDHALLDDRVGAGPQPGPEEDIGNVATADMLVIDVIRRLAIPLQHTLHRDFRVLRPLAGCAPHGVVENQLDACAREGLAIDRAVEYDIHHRVAAQGGRPRLAEHPANCIDYVGLAAPVWPDDADQLSRHVDRSGIDERLET